MDLKENTVKLGLMPPLTGLVGIYGIEIARAGQIACQEVNESGGVLGRPLELIIEDDGSLPDSSVNAAEKLVNQHQCSAIIGNLLSNSRIAVAYNVAEPCKIPYLNFSFYEGSISSRYFFHFAAIPNQQIEKMIPYMHETCGPRMFFAGNNYEWPRGSIDAAKRALIRIGGVVVGEEYLPIGVDDEDIEKLIDRVSKTSPDVFVPYFAGEDQVKLLTRFTERGLKKQMKVVMGHYDEMMASRLSAEVREGFYSSNSYFMSVDSDENRRYLARLAKQTDVTGIWPQGNGILTNFGEGTYVCVKAFAKAANLAGSLNPEDLVESLETITISAPQGEVQMNPEHHHARVNTYLSCCRADGEFEIIEKFGAIEPVLPEYYKHQNIERHKLIIDDIRLQARMLEKMNEAVFLVSSKDCTIVYSNLGAEKMFGYSEEELLSQSIECLNSPNVKKDEQTLTDILDILMHKGKWKGEQLFVKKNKTSFYCSVSISSFTHPLYNELWLWVVGDISDKKEVEGELTKYREHLEELVGQRSSQLKKSEAHLSQVLSSSPVVIYTAKAEGDYALTYVSENVKELFGYSAEQYFEDPGFWIKHIHPEDLPQAHINPDQFLKEGKRFSEYRFQLANGEYIWLHDESKLVDDEQGRTVEIIGYWADITNNKNAEAEINRAKLEAEKANNEKSQFLANMSHELRTPLNGILGMLELVKDYEMSDGVRKLFSIINLSGQQLLGIVNDILDFEKLDKDSVSIEETSFSPRILFQQANSLFEYEAAHKNIGLVLEFEDSLPDFLLGDSFRIKQIFNNLVANAIKFTRQGEVNIIVRWRLAEQELVVEVTDTGIGIPADRLDSVFNYFEQADATTTRKYGGTGLGLGISKKLVELMHGRMEVTSKLGQGSFFMVSLPLLPTTNEEGTAGSHEVDVTLFDANKLTVLVAEDNSVNQMVIKGFLKKFNIQADVVDNGDSAQRAVIADPNKYNLVLMDISMPKMDGYEATRRIRSALGHDLKPAIYALSANVLAEHTRKSKECGMNGTLKKPLNINLLGAVLKQQMKV